MDFYQQDRLYPTTRPTPLTSSANMTAPRPSRFAEHTAEDLARERDLCQKRAEELEVAAERYEEVARLYDENADLLAENLDLYAGLDEVKQRLRGTEDHVKASQIEKQWRGILRDEQDDLESIGAQWRWAMIRMNDEGAEILSKIKVSLRE